MVTWTLAKKDLRLLLRDRRAVVILIAMPFLFILVLGMALGEGFGQKPDDRLRISIVNLDEGNYDRSAGFPPEPWANRVQLDLAESAGIRVEIIPTLGEAEQLVQTSKRSAVLVFRPKFSERVSRCSFLKEGINPFYRDGVKLQMRDAGRPLNAEQEKAANDPESLDVELLRDPTQRTASSIIEQVAQVTLFRVILPYMISRAFEKVGDPDFIDRLSKQKQLPAGLGLTITLMPREQKKVLGSGLKDALQALFSKYNLMTGRTWADLTRSEAKTGAGAAVSTYQRSELRYQVLVPSYTVMFAFFLVLTVGWLFVAERRQGTLKRLRAAPLSRTQILLGKMLPCFALSLAQGLFLLGAAKLAFGMTWGSQPWWLLLVVFSTSLAAMGMALLVAAAARTETQVAIYGTLLVLVLAGLSGCLTGDRELMPETMQEVSRLTPHAWALDAYKQLLTTEQPNLEVVARACGVLAAFGAGFVGLAWTILRLD